MKQNYQNLPYTLSYLLMEVGDLRAIQEDGVLPLQIPGDTTTYYFQAQEVITSFDTSEYTWIGTLISPVPCVEDSSDYIENDCINGSFKMIHSDGALFGEMHIEDAYYQFKDLGEGLHILIKQDLDEFLEHDCGMSANETEVEEQEQEEGTNCPVRALVLYTDAALTAFPDVVNIIKLSIADVNFILHKSHIKEKLLKIVLAGTRLVDTTEFVETGDLEADLSSLPSNSAINFYRGVYDADVVVIMTNAGYSAGTGGVTTFGDFYDDVDSAFALVETGFATGPVHSFSHEIGHLFGARHERKPQDCASDGDNSGLSYSHGKIITKRFLGGISWQKKTVMAVCAGNSTIPRIEYFSNPNIEYGGKVIGNEQTNYNAKTIANAACRVAHYLNTEEPSVYLDAPFFVCPGDNAEITAVISGVPAPFIYYWQTGSDGFNYTPNPPISSSNNTFVITAPNTNGQSLWVRLTAGSIGGPLETASQWIMANDVDLNCEPHFASSTNSNGNTAPDLILSPNPTYGEISLKLKNFPNGIYHLILYNSFGQEIKRIEKTSSGRSSEVMNMDASVLPPGNYWLSIQSEYLSKTIPFTCLR